MDRQPYTDSQGQPQTDADHRTYHCQHGTLQLLRRRKETVDEGEEEEEEVEMKEKKERNRLIHMFRGTRDKLG